LGLTSSSYFWNRNQGNAEIGGDVIGSGNCFLRHGHDAVIRFGGQVFPNGVGSLQFIQPSILNVVEFNGHLQQIVKPFNLPFHNLTINNSSPEGVSLADDLTINGALSLINGHVYLADNNLLLGAEATIEGNPSVSGMVIATGSGELRKTFSTPTAFTFPVGNAGDQPAYTPVTLNFNSGAFSNGAYIGVNLSNSAYPGSAHNYLERFWECKSHGRFRV
jgi:trimeric autotransporter adhesin